MKRDRLKKFFYEGKKHKEHIIEAKKELNFPIKDYDNLSKIEKFALNTLVFRFSKLQDLIGAKIFRNYLEFLEYPTKDMNFFDILKEIEKENIVDIDSWSYLRELRNDIDYPEEFNEMIDKLNLLYQKSEDLIEIFNRLVKKYDEINSKRN